MVRITKVSTFFDRENNKQLQLVEGACESTDDKPKVDIATGSIMIEVDTGEVFFFSEKSNAWVPQFSFQSGGE